MLSFSYSENSKLQSPFNYFPNLFEQPAEWDRSKGMFKVGMKLETVDPLVPSTIRVASVVKVLNDGYFVVG